MPSKSPAQHRLMEAVAHSSAFAKKVGISQKVGKEFSKADKGKKFKKGGGLYANIHAKKSGGGVSLSVGRGEKLPTDRGAGLTAKGREKANRATGSHLQAPAPNPKTKKEEGRKKSFCARMSGVVKKSTGDAPRAKASLKRWNCPGW